MRILSSSAKLLARPHLAVVLPSAYCGLLFASGAVEINQPLLGLESIVYLVSQILLVVVAGMTGAHIAGKGRSREVAHDDSTSRWVFPLCWINVACFGASLAGYWASGWFGASVSLVDIRSGFADREATIFSYFTNLASPFSLITLGLLVFYYERLPAWLRAFAFLSSLGTTVSISVGQGGRYFVFTYGLLLGWWIMARMAAGKSNLLARRGVFAAIGVLSAAAVTLFLWLSIARSSVKEHQADQLLMFFQASAVPGQEILDRTEDINPTLANGIYEALLYWTAPIVAFDKVFTHWEIPPTFTTSISPFAERRLSAAGLIPTIESRADEWAAILMGYGIFPNGWATVSFSTMETFGRVGGMLFTTLVAFASGYAFARATKSRSFFALFGCGLVWLTFFLWFQRPVTLEPIFEFGVYWTAFFLVVRPVKRAKKTVILDRVDPAVRMAALYRTEAREASAARGKAIA